MEDTIVLRIAFDILNGASIKNIKNALISAEYYGFVITETNASPIGVFPSEHYFLTEH